MDAATTMLLPSALSCDGSQPSSSSRLQAALFASPPASPPTAYSQSALGNLVNSCRSLHSLIASPPTSPPMAQLPTPPLAHAPPPLKLRLRPRGKADATNDQQQHLTPRKKIVKRAPPRGVNKRRRSDDDDMGRDDVEEREDDDSDAEQQEQDDSQQQQPSTPKRARLAPEQLPLGLERADFHGLGLSNPDADNTRQQEHPGTDVEVAADGEQWSAEDDRVLVELVLEKLKLSKTEWQDCARSLGRDKHSVGRRWKSLMSAGDVGLKTRGRRARLHATWR